MLHQPEHVHPVDFSHCIQPTAFKTYFGHAPVPMQRFLFLASSLPLILACYMIIFICKLEFRT